MKYLISSVILIFSVGILVGQQQNNQDLTKNSLEEQFNSLYKRSNNYQVYKVVKKTDLNAYWHQVSDTLNAMNSKIKLSSKDIREQAVKIRELEESLASANGKIENLNAKMETISFLGGDWNKNSYKMTMWTIAFTLLGICIILALRFMRSNKVTRQTKRQLAQLETEFDSYRKGAIQKEQEIKRKLQDYINKVSELTGV